MHSKVDVDAKGELRFKGDAGKEPLLMPELEREGLYACGVAEHRWTESGARRIGDWLCIQAAACVTPGHYNGGVAWYLSPEATRDFIAAGETVTEVSVFGQQFLFNSFWATVFGQHFLGNRFWATVSGQQFLGNSFWATVLHCPPKTQEHLPLRL